MLICGIYMVVYINYAKLVAKNDYVEWDLKTVTAGDFTVEFDITVDFFEAFVQKHGKEKAADQSMGQHFRDWMHNKVEEKLSEMEHLGYVEPAPARIEVASTTFAFKNGGLISLLRQRGAAIQADKFDKMREIDAKINAYKNDQFDSLVRPVSIFMTFETEEGYQRALALPGDAKWFDGSDASVEMQGASEPSDIIWENREFTPRQRRCKEVIAVLVIGICLALAAGVIFYGRLKQRNYVKKYPKAPCEPFYETYGHRLEHFAEAEYEYNVLLEIKNKPFQFVGYL